MKPMSCRRCGNVVTNYLEIEAHGRSELVLCVPCLKAPEQPELNGFFGGVAARMLATAQRTMPERMEKEDA